MIKIGIVGTGGIAEWHVAEFQKNNDSTVIAACDVASEDLIPFVINLISKKDIIVLKNC
jgi:predicted dehydrogenase